MNVFCLVDFLWMAAVLLLLLAESWCLLMINELLGDLACLLDEERHKNGFGRGTLKTCKTGCVNSNLTENI